MMLYRKALIHFAFDKKWGEAKQLLSEHPNLRAAITKRFQLYLDVSHKASIQETAQATSMLKNFVKRQETIVEETEEGEKTRTKTIFKEDELDLLHTYPDEHPKPLPKEPFTGRYLLLRTLCSVTTEHKVRSPLIVDTVTSCYANS